MRVQRGSTRAGMTGLKGCGGVGCRGGDTSTWKGGGATCWRRRSEEWRGDTNVEGRGERADQWSHDAVDGDAEVRR